MHPKSRKNGAFRVIRPHREIKKIPLSFFSTPHRLICPCRRNYNDTDMRAKHETQQDYYTTIATKISKTAKQKLITIADGFNMSIYELLQSLLLLVVHHFDTDTPISHESSAMLNVFANTLQATKGGFSPLAIKDHQRQAVKSAILFVQRKDGQRPQTIAVSKDEQGRLTESLNTDKMLADYLLANDPDTLRVLKEERRRMNLFSLGHTLHQIVLRHSTPTADAMSEEIAELFNDIRIPSGQMISEQIHYKRKNNRWADYTTQTRRKSYRADV